MTYEMTDEERSIRLARLAKKGWFIKKQAKEVEDPLNQLNGKSKTIFGSKEARKQ